MFRHVGADSLVRGDGFDHLTDILSAGKVTLLFGAHDIGRNSALALAGCLAGYISRG
jgi:uncharacterized protein YeaO (DUF488 family)